MIVFLNGQFVPEADAVVSIFDRGFLYGDGLFETTRVCDGRPFLWGRHLARLRHGAELLQLNMPLSDAALTDFAAQLIERNQMPDSVLRLNLSRGTGPRGYSTKGCEKPTIAMSLHPAPELENAKSIRLITANQPLASDDSLTQAKTSNKLTNVLARSKADAHGADDALLINTHGDVAEATASNLFWISGNTVSTPPITSGAVAGITRGFVIELCQRLGLTARETAITRAQLTSTEGIFLTNSVQGITEASTLDGAPIPQSPLTARLRGAYTEALRAGH